MIQVQNLSYTYAGTEKPVLKNFSFWLYAGITFMFHLLLIWFLFRKFTVRSD